MKRRLVVDTHYSIVHVAILLQYFAGQQIVSSFTSNNYSFANHVLTFSSTTEHIIKRQRSVLSRRSSVHSKFKKSNYIRSVNDDSIEWEPNVDLAGDFERLDLAVQELTYESRYKQHVLTEKLNWIARNKRRLVSDFIRMVIFPLVFALTYTKMMVKLQVNPSLSIMQTYIRSMEYFYRVFLLGLPVITFVLLSFPRRMKTSNYNEEHEVLSTFPSVEKMVLDYGFSSVIVASTISLCRFLSSTFFKRAGTLRNFSFLPYFYNSVSMMINRLGFSASNHQFPSLLFDLEIKSLDGNLSAKIVLKFIKLYNIMLPFGFAADFASVLGCLALERKFAILPMWKTCSTLPWQYNAAFITSIFVPLLHIFAFRKIIRIRKEDSLSLAANDEAWSAVSNHKRLLWSRMWRRPRSISHVIRGWYLLWVAELPQSRLAPQRIPTSFNCFDSETDFSQSRNKYEMISLNGEVPAEDSKLKIIELLCEENEQEFVDRSSWVARAYADKAIRLQKDFDDKTFYVSTHVISEKEVFF